MKIILYQPDMAGNFGAIMRSCACFNVNLEVIEPCGFPLTSKAIRLAAMDYGSPQEIVRHKSWKSFMEVPDSGRLVLLTTKGATPLNDFQFRSDDRLIFWRRICEFLLSVQPWSMGCTTCGLFRVYFVVDRLCKSGLCRRNW